MIKPTQKQQKAPFSAFDTTSNFRSGLREVGQAFGQVGQAAASYATSIQQKKDEAQVQLASKADAERQVQYKTALDALNTGVSNKIGLKGIQELQDNVMSVVGTPLSSFLPEDSPVALTSEKAMSRYNNNFYKDTGNLQARFEANNAQSVIIDTAEERGDALQKFINTNLVDYFGVGTPISVFRSVINHPLFTSTEGQDVYSTAKGLTAEGREAYLEVVGKSMLGFAQVDLENTASPQDLAVKKDELREFISANPELNFDATDIGRLEDAYDSRLKELNDPTVLRANTVNAIKDVILAVDTRLNSDMVLAKEAARMFIDLQVMEERASTVLKPGDDSYKSLQATINYVRQFLPIDFPEGGSAEFLQGEYAEKIDSMQTPYQALLSEALRLDSPEDVSASEIIGARLNTFGLDKTRRSTLQNRLSRDVTQIQSKLASGDASFYGELNPVKRRLVRQAGAGDEAARLQLSLEYSQFAKAVKATSGTLMGQPVPSTFFIPQQQPIPSSPEGMVEHIKNNIKINGDSATNFYGGVQIANSDRLSPEEHAYYRGMWLYTNQTLRMQYNGEKLDPETAVNTVLSAYFDGEKLPEESKKLVNEVIEEDSSPMSSFINSLKYTDQIEASEALQQIIYGQLYKASTSTSPLDLTDKDKVVAYLNKSIEEKTLLPLFGYTEQNESGSYTNIPPEIAVEDIDYKREASLRGEGFFGAPGPGVFARMVAPLTRLKRDKAEALIVGDYWKFSVIGSLTQKYDLDVIKRATKDLAQQSVPAPSGFTGPNIPNVFSVSAQDTDTRRSFTEALMRGFDNNLVDMGEGVQQGQARIGLPIWEQNQKTGAVEQRVYVEYFDGNRYTRVHDRGEPLYVTLNQAKDLYDIVFNKEVTLGGNNGTLGPKGIRIDSVLDELFND